MQAETFTPWTALLGHSLDILSESLAAGAHRARHHHCLSNLGLVALCRHSGLV